MLSERMSRITGSPTSALIARVAALRREGKNIISLNVGEPDYGTPAGIKVAGIKAIADDFTKYTSGKGILDLRVAIANKLLTDNGVSYTADEIAVTVGAKQAVATCLMALCGHGDEVLLPVPCWVSYAEMIKLADATPVFVSTCEADSFALDLNAIETAITPKTKAIIICTPNNPTGAVYSENSLRELAELACRHDFYIIADEVYEKIIYDDVRHFSIASISENVRRRTITINGVSKAYAMTGWRIGYAAGCSELINAIGAIQSQTTSSACSISQKAAIAAFTGSQHDVQEMVASFKQRRDYMIKRIDAIPGFHCATPRGAFYLLPDVSTYIGKKYADCVIENSGDLAGYLLEKALVATVPGEAFYASNKLRISYSNSMENLQKALDRVEDALAQLHD